MDAYAAVATPAKGRRKSIESRGQTNVDLLAPKIAVSQPMEDDSVGKLRRLISMFNQAIKLESEIFTFPGELLKVLPVDLDSKNFTADHRLKLQFLSKQLREVCLHHFLELDSDPYQKRW